MRRFFLIIISVLLVISFAFLYRFLPGVITGLMVGGKTTVGVVEKLKGQITALVFQENIDLGEIQKITIELSNVGSVSFIGRIEVRIYWNNETGKLQEMAYYYDSQAELNPSMKRIYGVSFLPPNPGLYYIKVRVPYDTKVIERWGAFLVIYTPPPPPVQIIYPSPPPVTYLPPVVEEIGIPKLSLEYPKTIRITQGETKLFSILVKNIGEVSLNNLRLSISTTNLIKIEINPKQVFSLPKNESAIFLISIQVPETTPEGKYPFDFEVLSEKIKEGANIELEIVSILPPLKEEVYQTILNYEYIILEIQNEIDSAALRGIDIRIPLNTLNKARISLETARKYYEQEKYEDTKKELEETKKYLEDAVFQLASVSIIVYLPAFAPLFIVLIAIIIAIVFLILLVILRKGKEKKKKKRPKLLKAIETET